MMSDPDSSPPLSRAERILVEEVPYNISRDACIRKLVKLSKEELPVLRAQWRKQYGYANAKAKLSVQVPSYEQKLVYVTKMIKNDWPDGLHLLQVAEVECRVGSHRNVLHSRFVFQVIDYNFSALGMNKNEVLKAARDFYTENNNDVAVFINDTPVKGVFVLYLSFISNVTKTLVDVHYFLFSPTIPVVFLKGGRNESTNELMRGLLLAIYGVKSMKRTTTVTKNWTEVAELLANEKPNNVFSELAEEDSSGNPANIFSKMRKTKKNSYVSGKEARRRIVPLDGEVIQKRLQLSDTHFGSGSFTLEQTRFNLQVFSSTGSDDEDNDFKIDMTFRGPDVGTGIKKLIEKGFITESCPWLDIYASDQPNVIKVTKDGAEPFEY